ncbi:MAG: DUF2167 domain-containing protein [Chthoniobacter sp.]|uniref:DUF2167 domain-containing protein n=1 Tax=Chthoniobacter sp. TaxID=2510640 RepID=UPI0032A2B4CD
MNRLFLSVLLLLAVGLPLGRAENPTPREARLAEIKKLADGLNYQHGEITLRGGLARIKMPEGYRYLDPKDTQTVLTKIWDNPDTGPRSLGMLVPPNLSPASADGWAVIISYDEDGYVKDNDAAKINYNDLLKQMQEGVREASKEREKKGFAAIELVGWAAPPRYDANAHKMYWAKQLRFGDSNEDTLNYNIRMLGRRGVLVLNAVAGMGQMAEIEQATPAILSMVDFQEGHRYTDFQPSTDKVATYGLAALVTGGILAKAGFFKVLIAGILAAKKVVIVGVVALFGVIKKFFAKVTGRSSSDAQ